VVEKPLIFYSLSTCGHCEITKKMLDDLEVDGLYDTLRKIQEPKGYYYFNRDNEADKHTSG